MNSDFPRIITFLRKEKGLSQKQAAADMGISQALLSHYEKGIRECGLDFLVRTAEYYNVSCDYLLGRTVHREVASMSPEDIPDGADVSFVEGNMITKVNKKLLNNTASVIFDLLAQLGSNSLTNTVSNYLMCAQYQIFRTIYSADKNNLQSMFSISENKYKDLCSAAMLIDLGLINDIIESDKLSVPLSTEIISSCFEKSASSLFNLIQYSERSFRNLEHRV